MESRIMTRHPQRGKQGVNINRQKYNLVRETILTTIGEGVEITFEDLTENARRKLTGKLDGSVSWYVTTVKLDLEARGIIERIPGSRPQRLRLV